MAAAGIGNPAGAIIMSDGENPRSIGGVVRNEIISGGVFVFASGADNVVGSLASTLANSDKVFTRDASGGQFNGINLKTTLVSGAISIISRGQFLLQANGTVTGGTKVMCDGNNAVANLGSVAANLAATRSIGRSVTGAASGGFCLIDIQG